MQEYLLQYNICNPKQIAEDSRRENEYRDCILICALTLFTIVCLFLLLFFFGSSCLSIQVV